MRFALTASAARHWRETCGGTAAWLAARREPPVSPPAVPPPATPLDDPTIAVPEPADDATPQEGPRLRWKPNPAVFGTKFEDEEVDLTFALSNPGTQTVHLRKIEPSCGCIRVDRAQATLEPGARMDLQVTVRLAGMAGQFARYVVIYGDMLPESPARIAIHGKVLSRIDVSPPRVILRPATPDSESVADIEVRSNTDEPLDGLTVSSTMRGVTPQATIDGRSARIHLVATPFLKDFECSLVVRRGASERIVPVSYFAAQDVKAVPPRLVAGRGSGRDQLEARLVAREGVTIRVKSVESNRKDMTAEVVGGVLRVKIGEDAPAGPFSGEVVIVLEGAKPDRIRVPVTAYMEKSR